MIERIKLLLSVKNLSPAQLALSIGVQRSGISHILSGRNKPSLDFVLKILESYPEINESWLLVGHGEMLKSNLQNPSLFLEDLKQEDFKLEDSTQKEKKKEKPIESPVQNLKEEIKEPYEKRKVTGVIPEQKETVDTNQSNVNKVMVNSLIQQSSTKKMVQLIAIYEDDSFKIFHSI
ncbi:helix-turn-helix transcriptional regulator [Lentimicrobium sp. S6]|uniref:helix-turn-helix transcriptional regulator n=1 Tax=Lentimicrobium sp. S6 TaxID=2735872 RepID=UPI0015536CE2|nr:helix-turn-helix transcriptional regulator [Lentimicrobium sp. S6]NPD45431.1 helix-turn-helix transcriptional regulator [Lentimicrobium sp. S6]